MTSEARGAKTILVTGASDGIGRAAARQLGERGARVVVHGRSPEKAARVADELARETGRDAFVPVAGDLARLDDVRALAADVAARFSPLDVLVNNAGIFARTRELSADGFELTLAVNQLAPFLLTHLLIDALAPSARIVFVSSNVHRSVRALDFDDLDRARDWDGYAAYADSKLMNAATAFELARRLEPRGITVNAMHPGVIATKLLRGGFGMSGGAGLDRGAAGEVKLALDPALAGITGRYFDQTEESKASALANDRTLQSKVYEVCLERTGAKAM
ncbi:MAG TPA: SDR family oxidoreductase [Polyangia bacterium]|jgi:NAD(P)-dependent dehydrogenase (short-subunit alcohol dehydrogenase family)